ncbi:hypothetical protein [Pseudomonas sp. 65/3-MNA-CIBAN-0223]|uniref:hypothetical protein n=1 Tax=Pseudomonas sp. 65/3-MNA-CIBAN-0223 TaxID=3140476 RepID=UPI00331E27B0
MVFSIDLMFTEHESVSAACTPNDTDNMSNPYSILCFIYFVLFYGKNMTADIGVGRINIAGELSHQGRNAHPPDNIFGLSTIAKKAYDKPKCRSARTV